MEALEAHGFELRGADADFIRNTRVLRLVHLATGINADVRETLELLEKALDRSDLVEELERARTGATR